MRKVKFTNLIAAPVLHFITQSKSAELEWPEHFTSEIRENSQHNFKLLHLVLM